MQQDQFFFFIIHALSSIHTTHSLSWHRISRHSGYVDVFVKSRILSLYILYTFIPYKSTFVSWYFAYLDMFLGPKQCFHALIYFLSRQVYTQCTLWKSRSLSIFWPNFTPVNLSWGSVNRSLNMQGLRNRGACVIKSWLSHTCLSHF